MNDIAANNAPSEPITLYPVSIPAHCHIPEPVLQDERLHDGDKILYGRLRGYAGKNSYYCFVKLETLAGELRKNERSIRRSLKTLIDCGYLSKIRPHQRATTRYYFLMNERLGHWLYRHNKGGFPPPEVTGHL